MGAKANGNRASRRRSEPDTPAPATWRTPILIAAALILGVFLVFGRTIGYGFVNYDDPEYIVENPMVNKGLSAEGFVSAFTLVHSANWHPLTWLSHQLDCQIFGVRAWGHHLTNLLIHAANAVLVFLLLWRGAGAIWRSAFVAALFAVHPLRAESVAWISERKDVLCALLWLLTIAAYAAWTRRGGIRRYALTAVLLVLALLAKPMAVTLPFTLVLLDYWPLRRLRAGSSNPNGIGLGRSLIEKAPLFALVAILAAVTFAVQRSAGAMGAQNAISLPWRAANAAVATFAYIGKLLWPRDLAVFYPHPGPTLATWKIVLSCLALIAVTAAALLAFKRKPYPLMGWLWYLGALTPVIGIVQVGAQAMADRYTYIPTLGLLVVIVWGICDLARPAWRGRLAATGVAAILALGILGWRQAGVWRDGITLFEHTLAHTERNSIAHNNLGTALDDAGQTRRAVEEYRKALEIDPGYPRAHFNLANSLRKLGDLPGAVEHYARATKEEPQEPDYHANLGATLEAMGRLEEATTALKRGIEHAPDAPVLHFNLGNVQRKRRNYPESERAYLRAMELRPNDWEIPINLGSVYFTLEAFDKAAEAFQHATQLHPTAPNLANLALAQLRSRRFRNAAETYEQLARMEPARSVWSREQARALVKEGDMAGARAAYEEAIRRARRQPDPGAIQSLEQERATLK